MMFFFAASRCIQPHDLVWPFWIRTRSTLHVLPHLHWHHHCPYRLPFLTWYSTCQRTLSSESFGGIGLSGFGGLIPFMAAPSLETSSLLCQSACTASRRTRMPILVSPDPASVCGTYPPCQCIAAKFLAPLPVRSLAGSVLAERPTALADIAAVLSLPQKHFAAK